ncbi:MAG: TRAP transporter substrate-binding protein DctP [Clostridiales Family XIII bacterium]|jgi:tripartite ATP-independent transporter DctP family solute receptor|nr:TRAP transporter substrate-binding protein DctP [Clostridiales Family XIII bacterium]
MCKNKLRQTLWTSLLVVALLVFAAACGGGSSDSNADAEGEADSGAAATEEADAATEVERVPIVWANYGSSQMAPAFADRLSIEYIGANTKFDVDYKPDGVLGNEADIMQQIIDGTIQLASIGTSTMATYTDLLEVFQLPFLIGDYDAEREILYSDEANALFEAAGEQVGVQIVGRSENGIRHFANNIRPVKTVADLKGLKLRIVPSNMLTEAIGALGAMPQSVAYAETYSALQNGVVDGEEINLTSVYAMKHYEVLKYMSLIGMYPFPQLVIANQAWWDSLTAEEQDAILTACRMGADELFAKFLPDYEAEATTVCEEAGLVFNVIEGAERDAFVELVQPVWDQYAAKDPKIKALMDYAISLQ